jgi:hypothetical protein
MHCYMWQWSSSDDDSSSSDERDDISPGQLQKRGAGAPATGGGFRGRGPTVAKELVAQVGPGSLGYCQHCRRDFGVASKTATERKKLLGQHMRAHHEGIRYLCRSQHCRRPNHLYTYRREANKHQEQDERHCGGRAGIYEVVVPELINRNPVRRRDTSCPRGGGGERSTNKKGGGDSSLSSSSESVASVSNLRTKARVRDVVVVEESDVEERSPSKVRSLSGDRGAFEASSSRDGRRQLDETPRGASSSAFDQGGAKPQPREPKRKHRTDDDDDDSGSAAGDESKKRRR